MNKRRSASSAASRGADGDESVDHTPGPPPSARKKKKLGPKMCQQLYDTIRSFKKEDGTLLCDSFIQAPKKRQKPQKCEVSQPIDLLRVQEKLKMNTYKDLDELSADIELLVNNAKAFYKHDTLEYKDACELWKLYTHTRNALENGRPDINPIASSTPSTSSAPASKPNEPLQKKLQFIVKQLVEFYLDGRQLIKPFMKVPNKKRYPDYYYVIDKPIDIITIEANIKNGRYNSIEEMISDFRLMFSNCRRFNEEGSWIPEDGSVLEQVLNETLKELNCSYEKKTPNKKVNLKNQEKKLRTLYDAIRYYRGPIGYQLSVTFLKLPSKAENPAYYKIINSPIDMEKIAHKLKNNVYNSIDELASDFILMFDNECEFNEPHSQIYKDALILHRVCLQTRQMLRMDDDVVPDVSTAVQELLFSLFASVYNHKDEKGRCYSDSMAELPEHDDGLRVRCISLHLVKCRLDRGLYRRLDHFQHDMFAVFEKARRLSRTDSQIFSDSVELQSFFIAHRDRLCAAALASPALAFTRETLAARLQRLKLRRTPQEDDARSNIVNQPLSMIEKGDFLYVRPDKDNKERGIVQVVRLWTNDEGVPMMKANVYFRPQETIHEPTRKFLPQEVFKTKSHRNVPLDDATRRCYVMYLKDYSKFRPQGYSDKDVYVCDSWYNPKQRCFKKITVWERSEEDAMLVPFPRNVMCNPLGSDDGNTYYEQYRTVCYGVIKTGDYVYATDEGKQVIAQVDTIWETSDKKCYFRGPFLIFAAEVANIINKPLYEREVLLTSAHGTRPLAAVAGKCAVLGYRDYLNCRPTEVSESDVFVCERLYDERGRAARALPAALREYRHSKDVTVDEIYYFPKQQRPPARAASSPPCAHESMECEPQVTNPNARTEQDEVLLDDSLDGSSLDSSLGSPASPLSIGADENNELNNPPEVASATAESAEEMIPPSNDAAVPAPQEVQCTCRVCGRGDSEEQMRACDFCDDSYHTFCLAPLRATVPNGDHQCLVCYAEMCARDTCRACGRGDNAYDNIVCEGCDDAYHTFCLEPPLAIAPTTWYCPGCLAKKGSKPVEAEFGFEKIARESILQNFGNYGKMDEKTELDYFNMPARFKLRLIAEVKKYPVLCTSLDVDEDSETCSGAWQKIAEALQIDSASYSPTDCIKTWKSIKRSFVSYIMGDFHTRRVAVIRAMQCMFPDFNEDSIKNGAMKNSSEVRSVTAQINTAVPEPQPNPAGTEFELALIAEVKKYPVISKTLYEDIYSKRCNKAWEKIAKALQMKMANPRIPTHIDYCRDKWLWIKYLFILYQSRDEVVMQAMLSLYPPCNDLSSDSVPESDGHSEESRAKNRTAAPPTQEAMCEGADENNELNNPPEVASATAESAEEMIPPSNDAAVPAPQQAATRGNPRSTGARPTERAVSLAIVDHLFDSLRSPAGKTDIRNSLMQLVYTYQPHVLSDIIEYATRQPDLFNIDWSGLPIPEDLCREMWRRDAEEKLRKFYNKISSSKRRAKKGN